MKVLLICDQQGLVDSFREQCAAREEDVTQLPVNWQAIGDSVNLASLLEQQQPDFVLCAVMLPVTADKKALKHYQSIVDTSIAYAKSSRCGLVFLSSAAVFSAAKISYSENDSCEATLPLAQFYLDQEKRIQSSLKHFIILRTSWLYSSDEGNFLVSVIEAAINNELISFNSAGKGCPTSVHDAARVLMAILLQLNVGADAWGTYHYASSDAAIGFQFVESILAQASQYDGNIDARTLHFEHSDTAASTFYFEPVILNCQKLLNTFGIHQKSWRPQLAEVVKNYFNEKAGD